MSPAEQAVADLPHLEKLRPLITELAAQHGLQPSIVAAVCSQETRGGRPEFLIGDAGHGHGPMQLDDRSKRQDVKDACQAYAATVAAGAPDHRPVMALCCAILAESYATALRWQRTRDTPTGQRERFALAAYNTGPRNAEIGWEKFKDCDHFTAGGAYGAHVLERARALRAHGW